ncbi:DivIVA domain-containing protein [[Clostridium] polysaccharolyticum]|uniref:DivIVA protein n=1 Tax=[Clostridium] polysaccharolyticum TaxID=29364 RepID=A0A1I0E1V4_9FIRM|nr:DivIVA domain-containing protein [[Clostridium] polysaccharolyticum]SET38819.1 DivIVA protein [[Clostridium] polysaccharolyticum]
MLTPIEIQGITFKTGRGYKKDDVDSFMKALHHDYEIMYKENMELKEKVSALNDGLKYYKNLEKTLQKALVLAEKTSEETKAAAQKHAETTEKEAKLKADKIIYDAKQELGTIEAKIQELLQNFEIYKLQFKQIVTSQMDLLNSNAFDIKKKEQALSEELEKKETAAAQKQPVSVKEDINQVEKAELKEEAEETKKEVKEKQKPQKKEEIKREIRKEDTARKIVRSGNSDLDIQRELASSIEALEKEEKEMKEQDEPDAKEIQKKNIKETAAVQEIKKEAKEEKREDLDSLDTQTDMEIKMLQKLLNEIRRGSDAEASDKDMDFEYVNADSND